MLLCLKKYHAAALAVTADKKDVHSAGAMPFGHVNTSIATASTALSVQKFCFTARWTLLGCSRIERLTSYRCLKLPDRCQTIQLVLGMLSDQCLTNVLGMSNV